MNNCQKKSVRGILVGFVRPSAVRSLGALIVCKRRTYFTFGAFSLISTSAREIIFCFEILMKAKFVRPTRAFSLNVAIRMSRFHLNITRMFMFLFLSVKIFTLQLPFLFYCNVGPPTCAPVVHGLF